jgi:hypothetical protein
VEPVLQGTTPLNDLADRHSAGQREGSFGIRIKAKSDSLDIVYPN